MWRRGSAGDIRIAKACSVARGLVVAAALGATACGGDRFDPGDAGDAGNVGPGSGGAASTGAASTGGAGDSTAASVVSVCKDLCTSQVEKDCHRILSNPADCGWVCEFLGDSTLVDDACRKAVQTAFQCQLDNDVCSTVGCNDLLKASEAECPELPNI